VPYLTTGPALCASPRNALPDAFFDVHLMVTDPAFFIKPFADAGADSVNFHIEPVDDPVAIARTIRDLGLGVAVTLKPATPAEAIASVVGLVDMVLVMTVEPGFGGQSFMHDQLDKIRTIRGMLEDWQRIEVDGGISPVTAPLCRRAGTDVFVAGSDVFASEDPAQAARAIQAAIAEEDRS